MPSQTTGACSTEMGGEFTREMPTGPASRRRRCPRCTGSARRYPRVRPPDRDPIAVILGGRRRWGRRTARAGTYAARIATARTRMATPLKIVGSAGSTSYSRLIGARARPAHADHDACGWASSVPRPGRITSPVTACNANADLLDSLTDLEAQHTIHANERKQECQHSKSTHQQSFEVRLGDGPYQ